MAFASVSRRSTPTEKESYYEKALLEQYKSGLNQKETAQGKQQQAGIDQDAFVAKTVVDMLPHISRNPNMLRSITAHPDWVQSTYPTLRRQGLGHLFAQDAAGNWQVNYQEEDKPLSFEETLVKQAEQMFPSPESADVVEMPAGMSMGDLNRKIIDRRADWVAGKKAQSGITQATATAALPNRPNIEKIYEDISAQDAQAEELVMEDPQIVDFVSRLMGRNIDPKARPELQKQLDEVKGLKKQQILGQLLAKLVQNRKLASGVAKDQSAS